MIEVELDARSLARVAVRASPVAEVLGVLRAAVLGTSRGEVHAVVRAGLRDADVALAALLVSAGPYQPDFLGPRPPAAAAGRLDALDEQLAAIAATSDVDFSRQARLAISPTDCASRSVADLLEHGTAERVARGLRRVADAVPQAVWDADHALIDAEIDRVCRHAARWGIGAALGVVHPDVSWDGRVLRLDKPYVERLDFRDQELVVTPSAAVGNRLLVQVCSVVDAGLVYPVRRPTGQRATHALDDLLGRTRADILRDLAVPRTTSELATRHQVAKATVSHHLGVLARSGLVARDRDGKRTFYVINGRGRHLVG